MPIMHVPQDVLDALAELPTYGSTATWRGGIGGQAMTQDVCDQCWGSGDADRAWPSRRRFEALEREHANRKEQ